MKRNTDVNRDNIDENDNIDDLANFTISREGDSDLKLGFGYRNPQPLYLMGYGSTKQQLYDFNTYPLPARFVILRGEKTSIHKGRTTQFQDYTITFSDISTSSNTVHFTIIAPDGTSHSFSPNYDEVHGSEPKEFSKKVGDLVVTVDPSCWNSLSTANVWLSIGDHLQTFTGGETWTNDEGIDTAWRVTAICCERVEPGFTTLAEPPVQGYGCSGFTNLGLGDGSRCMIELSIDDSLVGMNRQAGDLCVHNDTCSSKNCNKGICCVSGETCCHYDSDCLKRGLKCNIEDYHCIEASELPEEVIRFPSPVTLTIKLLKEIPLVIYGTALEYGGIDEEGLAVFKITYADKSKRSFYLNYSRDDHDRYNSMSIQTNREYHHEDSMTEVSASFPYPGPSSPVWDEPLSLDNLLEQAADNHVAFTTLITDSDGARACAGSLKRIDGFYVFSTQRFGRKDPTSDLYKDLILVGVPEEHIPMFNLGYTKWDACSRVEGEECTDPGAFVTVSHDAFAPGKRAVVIGGWDDEHLYTICHHFVDFLNGNSTREELFTGESATIDGDVELIPIPTPTPTPTPPPVPTLTPINTTFTGSQPSTVMKVTLRKGITVEYCDYDITLNDIARRFTAYFEMVDPNGITGVFSYNKNQKSEMTFGELIMSSWPDFNITDTTAELNLTKYGECPSIDLGEPPYNLEGLPEQFAGKAVAFTLVHTGSESTQRCTDTLLSVAGDRIVAVMTPEEVADPTDPDLKNLLLVGLVKEHRLMKESGFTEMDTQMEAMVALKHDAFVTDKGSLIVTGADDDLLELICACLADFLGGSETYAELFMGETVLVKESDIVSMSAPTPSPSASPTNATASPDPSVSPTQQVVTIRPPNLELTKNEPLDYCGYTIVLLGVADDGNVTFLVSGPDVPAEEFSIRYGREHEVVYGDLVLAVNKETRNTEMQAQLIASVKGGCEPTPKSPLPSTQDPAVTPSPASLVTSNVTATSSPAPSPSISLSHGPGQATPPPEPVLTEEEVEALIEMAERAVTQISSEEARSAMVELITEAKELQDMGELEEANRIVEEALALERRELRLAQEETVEDVPEGTRYIRIGGAFALILAVVAVVLRRGKAPDPPAVQQEQMVSAPVRGSPPGEGGWSQAPQQYPQHGQAGPQSWGPPPVQQQAWGQAPAQQWGWGQQVQQAPQQPSWTPATSAPMCPNCGATCTFGRTCQKCGTQF